ncbi:MAG: S8 family serine peptidase [Chthoniobacterales bacterium]
MKPLALLACLSLGAISAWAQNPVGATIPDAIPENLGLGLRELAALSAQDQAQLNATLATSHSIMSDTAGRVLVNVNLNGTEPASAVAAKLTQLGAAITAVETAWRNGVISASLPLAQAAAAAKLPGVQSVMLAHRPIRRVGSVTAESSFVEHAREVNTPGSVTPQGLLGRGLSVGLVSDSFDKATAAPRASIGVASGDLPGPGNPDGYLQPVVVLADDSSPSVDDEGRAMAEVVHDIAPAAKICFAAAGNTQAAMAASIRNLRTNSLTRCDIIADDIAFPDEPFFSDGIITQAVEEVVNSSSLAGPKVSYFSASGNNPGAYTADANILPGTVAQSYRGNLNLSQIPAQLVAGGYQNVSATGTPAIAIGLATGAGTQHTFTLQWDDPFNRAAVTTDYNLLVFSATGQYLASVGGADNNQATDQPVEVVDLQPNTTYQLVISLRTSSAPVARHLRLISADGGDFTAALFANDAITIFGHAAAPSANCVAAYVYDNTPQSVADYNPGAINPPPGPYVPVRESFNAGGGNLPYYFDAQGQRLTTPELRVKPDFAAADGVDTSFFPSGASADYDNNGYPNFFGTSAAAPNAAAFAALLLEAAGGPGTLSPAQVKTTFQQTAFAHDLDPNFSGAVAARGTASVTVNASGDDSNESADSPTFFTTTFSAPAGEALTELTIELANTGLVFDQSADVGFPFTVGANPGGVSVTPALSDDRRMLTLTFGSTFTSGKSISFGIDRDLAGISAGGNSADLLAGASITAVTASGQTIYGAFANQLGSGFAPAEGYGFIDARRAVQSIVSSSTAAGNAPANLSTRGVVGQGDAVLIGSVIIRGTAAKKVIIRAIGPSVPLAGALSDPTLELFDANGQRFAFDDNWQDDPIQAAQINASGVPPRDARESALVETLSPGAYTAIVRGAGGNTGVALVEVYDLDSQPAASQLANIATRGAVQTEDNLLIAGFILNRGPAQVVARATGPSLASAGVVGALADPSLELHDAQGALLMYNDNWQQDAFQAMQIQTIGLAPPNALDSALTTTLNPAAYTLIVRGAHSSTGVSLVEVYDVQ